MSSPNVILSDCLVNFVSESWIVWVRYVYVELIEGHTFDNGRDTGCDMLVPTVSDFYLGKKFESHFSLWEKTWDTATNAVFHALISVADFPHYFRDFEDMVQSRSRKLGFEYDKVSDKSSHHTSKSKHFGSFKMSFNDNSPPNYDAVYSPNSINSLQENVPPTTTIKSSKNHSPRPYINHPYYALASRSRFPVYRTPCRYANTGWHQYQHPKRNETTTFTDGISMSVREAFIPPRHNFTPKQVAPKQVTPEGKWKNNERDSITPSDDGVTFELQGNDIVCGRGAPSNSQHGNQLFKDLVEEHQTSYLYGKRADKPKIAMHLMDEVKARGGRFVRRVKTASNGRSFGWEVLEEKRSYEKVCQALRDGAPEHRRKMLASTKIREDLKRDDEVTSESPAALYYENSGYSHNHSYY
jgi:hypothetical protein